MVMHVMMASIHLVFCRPSGLQTVNRVQAFKPANNS